jgi:hypothetical protein
MHGVKQGVKQKGSIEYSMCPILPIGPVTKHLPTPHSRALFFFNRARGNHLTLGPSLASAGQKQEVSQHASFLIAHCLSVPLLLAFR